MGIKIAIFLTKFHSYRHPMHIIFRPATLCCMLCCQRYIIAYAMTRRAYIFIIWRLLLSLLMLMCILWSMYLFLFFILSYNTELIYLDAVKSKKKSYNYNNTIALFLAFCNKFSCHNWHLIEHRDPCNSKKASKKKNYSNVQVYFFFLLLLFSSSTSPPLHWYFFFLFCLPNLNKYTIYIKLLYIYDIGNVIYTHKWSKVYSECDEELREARGFCNGFYDKLPRVRMMNLFSSQSTTFSSVFILHFVCFLFKFINFHQSLFVILFFSSFFEQIYFIIM